MGPVHAANSSNVASNPVDWSIYATQASDLTCDMIHEVAERLHTKHTMHTTLLATINYSAECGAQWASTRGHIDISTVQCCSTVCTVASSVSNRPSCSSSVKSPQCITIHLECKDFLLFLTYFLRCVQAEDEPVESSGIIPACRE